MSTFVIACSLAVI